MMNASDIEPELFDQAIHTWQSLNTSGYREYTLDNETLRSIAEAGGHIVISRSIADHSHFLITEVGRTHALRAMTIQDVPARDA